MTQMQISRYNNIMLEVPQKIEKTENSVDLSIVWSIHNFCNFNCSYCPEYNSNGSEKWLDLEKAKHIVDMIHQHYSQKLGFKKILFSFTGGEPMFFKGFTDLIQHISSKGMYSGLTSNGSGSLKLWEKIIDKLEFISISYHPEFINDESLLKLLNLMHDDSRVIIPTIRLMSPSEEIHFKKAKDFVDKLKERYENYAYEFVKIQNDFGVGIKESNYSNEQESFLINNNYTEIRKSPEKTRYSDIYLEHQITYKSGKSEILRANDLVNNNTINFQNWDCNAGLESLYIDYNGDVFMAGCKINGAIINLQRENSFEFPANPVTCSFKRCICQADIMISKKAGANA